MIAFLLTPWVFIAILAVISLIELFTVELEKFGWSTILFAGVLVLLQLKFDLLTLILNDPFRAGYILVGYVVIGLGWSMMKWWMKLLKFKRKVKKAKEESGDNYSLLATKLDISIYINYKEGEEEKLKKEIEEKITYKIPSVRKNGAKIKAWIAFWPYSITASILNDPVRRFFSFIFESFRQTYEAIQKQIEKEIKKLI